MAFQLFDYLQKQGLRLVEMSIRPVVGKSATYILQEDHYRQTVIQPAWEALPPPVRLHLRKRHTDWVRLFIELREQIFATGDGLINLRKDALAKLALLLRRFYPLDQAEKPTANDPPLATPVNPRPVESTPRERASEPVVGIDLGTTYSLIAHVDAQGRPSCIVNGQGDLLTPSVVMFEEDGTIVGKEALMASLTDPDKVAECVKRDMGAKVYRKKINGEYLPPEVISSLILRSLKADAERKLGCTISQAVITVPAYFEETRRRATMDAGRLAGFDVLDIINEPTAAAIAYGYHLGFLDATGKLPSDKPLRVLVFDLGGGTFDVTIVEIQGTAFKALATDGDVHLGGRDWDEQLIQLVTERFKRTLREDPRDNPFTMQELWLSAESAKRTLTERKKATIHINHLGMRLKHDVSREEFETATAALLERTRLTTELVLQETRSTWAEVDRVLLVGGSTRMPMIRRMLRELTGKEPEGTLSPDEAVAHGAALYAELLAPRSDKKDGAFTVTNVNSHSLGILGKEVSNGRQINKIIIPKNTPLPQTVSKVFRTFRSNQHSVLIKVLEGENERPEVCTAIGTCAIRNLPPELPAGWPIRVSYTYEANGRLHVRAKLKGHAASVSADFEHENHMPDEDLDLWTQYVSEELREEA